MDKRYQVFISSTFTDLKEERKAIIEGLLNAKYIPSGMEMFSASNDEQFKYIKKIIDTCDYYVLIVGARYGSINSTTGKSFTEQEYDYAIKKGIPVLAFLHDDPYNLPAEKREDEKKELLEKFRNKVLNADRLCKMWHSSSELTSLVIISLVEEVAENPQMGWIRGDIADTTELLSQINMLRNKNDDLKKEYDNLKKEYEFLITPVNDNIASGDDVFEVIGEKEAYLYDDDSWLEETRKEFTWKEIFSAVGPYLFVQRIYDDFTYYLRESLNSAYDFNFIKLNDNCVQVIKIQLCVLGLIEINNMKFNGADVEGIVITERGKTYLLEIKTVKK